MKTDLKIFASKIEDSANKQINLLSKSPLAENSKIRIMPDVHAGTGCTIGTTMTITDKVCPNLIGVDIGCGMYSVKISKKITEISDLNSLFNKLDNIIKNKIPFVIKLFIQQMNKLKHVIILLKQCAYI